MAFYNNLPPYSLLTAPQFLRGDRSWSPLSLCLFCLFLFVCDLRFHLLYKLCELFLAFLSCFGIYVLGYAFTVDSRREPPLVEVVVYHCHATGAALAYLAFVGLKFLLRRGFRGGGFTCLGRLRFGHLRVCTANLSVDPHGCLLLHGVGDMAVDVERGLRADVTYHSGECLDIHTVFKCHGCKCVAQVVETDLLAPRSLQYLLEFAVDRVGISRLSFLDW